MIFHNQSLVNNIISILKTETIINTTTQRLYRCNVECYDYNKNDQDFKHFGIINQPYTSELVKRLASSSPHLYILSDTFSLLQKTIEQKVEESKEKVILIGFSLGTSFMRYFTTKYSSFDFIFPLFKNCIDIDGKYYNASDVFDSVFF